MEGTAEEYGIAEVKMLDVYHGSPIDALIQIRYEINNCMSMKSDPNTVFRFRSPAFPCQISHPI